MNENIYFLSEINSLVDSSVKNISEVLDKNPTTLKIGVDYTGLVTYKKAYKPIFHYISFSVLCGEYYSQGFEAKITEIEKNIKILSEIVIPNNSGIVGVIYKKLAEIKNDIIGIVDHFILFYNEFYKKLKSSLNNDNKIFIDLNYKKYINDFDEEKYILNFSELNVDYYKWIFCINLYTAQLDEGYVCDRDTLYELIMISFKIRKIHFNRSKLFRDKLSVTNTTFYKCDFLILKLLYRLNKTENKHFVIARQLQDSSPNYYSNIPYIWLKDLLKDSALVNSNQRTEKVQDVFDRFRIETINTNGNVFDGNGGPEFKFFRNSPTSYTTGFYGFATILTLNLSASAAGSTNEIIVGNYINNILHDNWHIIDFRSLIGTYEQDGGVIKNQQVSGIGIKADVLGIPILNISFSSTITRKDDLIDKYEMYRSSFVNNVQLRQNWGWGFRTINYNGTHILPIRRTNHTDLTITYRNY